MSKVLISVPALDLRILKRLVDDVNMTRINAEDAISRLAAAKADYDEFTARLAPGVDLTGYTIDATTNQLVPKPDPIPPPPPVKAPDADLPPAPFREADKVSP